MLQRGVLSTVMMGLAPLGEKEMRKIRKLVAQDNPPPLPPSQWIKKGRKEAADLDYATLCDTVRAAA